MENQHSVAPESPVRQQWLAMVTEKGLSSCRGPKASHGLVSSGTARRAMPMSVLVDCGIFSCPRPLPHEAHTRTCVLASAQEVFRMELCWASQGGTRVHTGTRAGGRGVRGCECWWLWGEEGCCGVQVPLGTLLLPAVRRDSPCPWELEG